MRRRAPRRGGGRGAACSAAVTASSPGSGTSPCIANSTWRDISGQERSDVGVRTGAGWRLGRRWILGGSVSVRNDPAVASRDVSTTLRGCRHRRVSCASGLRDHTICGLPDSAARQARQRRYNRRLRSSSLGPSLRITPEEVPWSVGRPPDAASSSASARWHRRGHLGVCAWGRQGPPRSTSRVIVTRSSRFGREARSASEPVPLRLNIRSDWIGNGTGLSSAEPAEKPRDRGISVRPTS